MTSVNARLMRLVQRASSEYLFDPRSGVTQVGLGLRERGGVLRAEIALRFHVPVKLKRRQLTPAGVSPVPATFDGVPTDVLQGVYAIQPSLLAWGGGVGPSDPIHGGISVGSLRGSTGTLGALVGDRKSGAPMLLSNSHVLATPYGAAPGLGTCQPGMLDGGDGDALVGRLARDGFGAGLDAAVSWSEDRRRLKNHQAGIGPLRGVGPPRLGMQVVKSGRTTGVTFGVVSEIGANSMLAYGGGRRIVRQVLTVTPRFPGPLSGPGDSGSVWLDPRDRTAVGLHFAGAPRPIRALAVDMAEVLRSLDVELLTDDVHS